MCAICFTRENTVSTEEIKEKRNVGGKTLYLSADIDFYLKPGLLTSGGSSNCRQKKKQSKEKKKKHMETAVASGRRKQQRVDI